MSFFKKLKEKFTTQEQKEKEVEAEVSIGEKFKQGLTKTRNSFTGRVNELVARYRKVDEDFLKNLKKS